ncbi:MAG: hypothetical protein ABJL99_09510 [Aliishimia sp.]
MTDKRFSDRLKRIDKRLAGGAKPEMLAGIGDVAHAKREAARTGFPFLSMVMGAGLGYGALYLLNDRLGLEGALALIETPAQAVPLAQSDMALGGAGAGLATLVALFLYALFKGYKAPKLHAFSFSALAGACAAAAVVLMRPDVLMALVENYI